MAFLALLIGTVLLVSTIRNTHGQLLTALRTDVPAFAVWGSAIFGIALIGFIPGLKPVSRGLLALIVVVIVLTNYKNLVGAFTGIAAGGVQAQAREASANDGETVSTSWDMLQRLAQVGGVDFSDILSANQGASA